VSEHAHTTFAIPETTQYPEPPESIAAYSLRLVVLGTVGKLESATIAFASASADLADALAADADTRLNLDYLEDDFRARAYRDGLPGTNEAQRAAFLAVRLADDPTVDAARQARDSAHRARLKAEHDFRVAGQLEKSLRARLDALTALVRQP
jgi:hypothetical protein